MCYFHSDMLFERKSDYDRVILGSARFQTVKTLICLSIFSPITFKYLFSSFSRTKRTHYTVEMSWSQTPQRSSPVRSRTPSRESTLLRLVQDYHQLTLVPWGSRVAILENQVKRDKFFADRDADFLSTAYSKNVAFARNLETLLEEAVYSGVGIENGAVRRAYAAWATSEELNKRIAALLEQYRRTFANGQRSASRCTSPSVNALERRSASPSRRTTPSRPRCMTFEEVGEKLGKKSPRPSDRGAASAPMHVSPENRSLLLAVKAMSQQPASEVDHRYAREVFCRLYGAHEGPRQFHKWFDEQAVIEVRRGGRYRQ